MGDRLRHDPRATDAPALPNAPDPTVHWIDTADGLARCCARWAQAPALGVDTEFVRERTFFARLGLIQVGDATGSTLIDVAAIEDLGPLAAIFESSEVVKIFHACGEDLEVLHHRFGAFPNAIFDTQLAAAFAGQGASLGYRPLVASMFGVSIPKDETRTDWTRRPLSDAQCRYAALDVAYLVPAYDILRRQLEQLDRSAWLREEVVRLANTERFLPDPERQYRRVKGGGGLPPRKLAVLRALAQWREHEARKRDLPRGFVVTDSALNTIAAQTPRSADALRAIGDLHPRQRKRFGADIVQAVP